MINNALHVACPAKQSWHTKLAVYYNGKFIGSFQYQGDKYRWV
jgi:hypothetical protein